MRTTDKPYRRMKETDLPTLFNWRNSESFRRYCTSRKAVTRAEFATELVADLNSDRFEQVLILHRKRAVGTMYTYRYNSVDGSLYVSAFLADEAVGSGVGAKAFILWCDELFNRLNLHKIYLEVYSYNAPVLKILKRFGVPVEGRLIGHRRNGETRDDLLIFALYRDALDGGLSTINRVSGVTCPGGINPNANFATSDEEYRASLSSGRVVTTDEAIWRTVGSGGAADGHPQQTRLEGSFFMQSSSEFSNS